MLPKDKNELLTRVGPGSAMNAVFRRYWLPALLSSDLLPDGDPKRARLLGEEYVAFRDSAGQVGFLDNACSHRGTSLILGRNEGGGLRCIFHGWKYAVDGTILEMPNVRNEELKHRFKQPAYPVREAGGLVWVYLGDSTLQPEFREYEYMRLPASHRMVERFNLDCNYLQVMEGGLDSSHVGILHTDLVNATDVERLPVQLQRRQKVNSDMAPRIEVRDTEFGFHYAAIRDANDGSGCRLVRVTAYVAPTTVMIPPNMYIVHYIPYDDLHTGWIVTHWNPEAPVDVERARRAMGINVGGIRADDHVLMNADNGYLQDREAMRNGSWSGLYGVIYEDAAVNLGQGPVLDRTKEHLVQADAACTHVRRLLLEAIRRSTLGEDPPGLKPTSAQTIQALDAMVAADDPWTSCVPGNIELPTSYVGAVG